MAALEKTKAGSGQTMLGTKEKKPGEMLARLLAGFLAILIAIAMIATLLLAAGCSQQASNDPSESAAEAASGTEQTEQVSQSDSEDGQNSGGFVAEDSATVSVDISDDAEGEA
jgi:cytoskeletal protein RodZ